MSNLFASTVFSADTNCGKYHRDRLRSVREKGRREELGTEDPDISAMISNRSHDCICQYYDNSINKAVNELIDY